MADDPADPRGSTPEPEESSARDPEWRHRKRLVAIFGDVLPDTTADERDSGAGPDDEADRWLRSQVPPHHG